MSGPYTLFDRVSSQLGGNGLFLEIGTARGVGSTTHLNRLAAATGNSFVTVDVNPIYTGPAVKTYNMSGEVFAHTVLPGLKKQISLVYMDGFDWTQLPVAVRSGQAAQDSYNLIKQYAAEGLTLNNVNSTISHLASMVSIAPYLNQKCAVMFNSTWFDYENDAFIGKGSAAAYLLLAQGFQLLSCSYQSNYVMLGKGLSITAPNLNLASLNEVYTGPAEQPYQIIYTND